MKWQQAVYFCGRWIWGSVHSWSAQREDKMLDAQGSEARHGKRGVWVKMRTKFESFWRVRYGLLFEFSRAAMWKKASCKINRVIFVVSAKSEVYLHASNKQDQSRKCICLTASFASLDIQTARFRRRPKYSYLWFHILVCLWALQMRGHQCSCNANQSPKGIMRSAVPSTCFFDVVTSG